MCCLVVTPVCCVVRRRLTCCWVLCHQDQGRKVGFSSDITDIGKDFRLRRHDTPHYLKNKRIKEDESEERIVQDIVAQAAAAAGKVDSSVCSDTEVLKFPFAWISWLACRQSLLLTCPEFFAMFGMNVFGNELSFETAWKIGQCFVISWLKRSLTVPECRPRWLRMEFLFSSVFVIRRCAIMIVSVSRATPVIVLRLTPVASLCKGIFRYGGRSVGKFMTSHCSLPFTTPLFF